MTETKRRLISNILALGFLGVGVGVVVTVVAGGAVGETFLIGVGFVTVLGGLGAWGKMSATMDNRAQQMGPTPIWPVAVFAVAATILNEFVSFTEGAVCEHCGHSPAALLPLADGLVVFVAVFTAQSVWSAIADNSEGGDAPE